MDILQVPAYLLEHRPGYLLVSRPFLSLSLAFCIKLQLSNPFNLSSASFPQAPEFIRSCCYSLHFFQIACASLVMKWWEHNVWCQVQLSYNCPQRNCYSAPFCTGGLNLDFPFILPDCMAGPNLICRPRGLLGLLWHLCDLASAS